MKRLGQRNFTIVMVFFCILQMGLFSGCSQEKTSKSQKQNVADQLSRDILNIVKRSSIALDDLVTQPKLADLLLQKDKNALTRFANSRLEVYGGVFDVIAIFNAEGHIVAMNTKTSDGVEIDPKKISNILDADFKDREVVQICLINKETSKSVQFQTQCDFTPLLYGSSGLSVAITGPVKQRDGAKIGAVSVRLNFNRISHLLASDYYKSFNGNIFLVSDEGEYYSEGIAKNTIRPPLNKDEIKAIQSSEGLTLGAGFVRHSGQDIYIKKVEVPDIIEGGNIHIMVLSKTSHV